MGNQEMLNADVAIFSGASRQTWCRLVGEVTVFGTIKVSTLALFLAP
jgi:hypothetical protein